MPSTSEDKQGEAGEARKAQGRVKEAAESGEKGKAGAGKAEGGQSLHPPAALEKRAGKKRPRPNYSAEQVEQALLAVAYANGNTQQAARDLKQAGLPIDQKTLWGWSKKRYVERYEQLWQEVLPGIRARVAQWCLDAAERQAEVAAKMTERLSREADDIPVRDLPGGLRNVVVSAAVNLDKAQLYSGQPTHRIAIDLPGTLAELKELGVEVGGEGVEVIDAEAEEMPDDDSSAAVLTAGEEGDEDDRNV